VFNYEISHLYQSDSFALKLTYLSG
jgi:hypothetical protein